MIKLTLGIMSASGLREEGFGRRIDKNEIDEVVRLNNQKVIEKSSINFRLHSIFSSYFYGNISRNLHCMSNYLQC